MFKRTLLRGTAVVASALLIAVFAAHAHSPYDTVVVTRHYDAGGVLVGVEAMGPCGFALYGATGASSSTELILCRDIDRVELPY
ncbi:hypothetical protein [Marilutibacter maris]|uniref:hypothetical protein n=1 Tax=Marilutibacter maris TaxID=1605891 RepID=UPI000DA84B7D|nr:hypothetical protein [Lysobacter maris]